MCNQSVGLIAGALERTGIATVCLQLLQGIAEEMSIPRSLWVPFPHGYALGAPGEVSLQHRILDEALALLEAPTGPVIRSLSAHEKSGALPLDL